ncbi:hypothetical protein MSHOH_3011 [Methanosarcina horonobensis HB-1 = JCM 15518]|uniref:Uncharacterized protein n=1 Tax=Methanosarcina horonobensis HB-1 = JCM 15518 TaxID=1434110 RepID=A0A0E3SC38_9EURY|nr:hypothetical protein [Methanosarcina horonobensis]AKB79494.1 hypothetical protein MSHOH_3011 [Methanosarcina horonobensis HB-1 = JCM 15518]
MSYAPAYGLWSLVIINSLIFIMFAFSFTHPKTSRDWRSLGGFAAFTVALFTEMYGFPLTIYLLSGWLASHIQSWIYTLTMPDIYGVTFWAWKEILI